MWEIIKEELSAEDMVLTYTLLGKPYEGRTRYAIRVREAYAGKVREVLLDDLTEREEEARRFYTLFRDGLVTAGGAEDALIEIQYS